MAKQIRDCEEALRRNNVAKFRRRTKGTKTANYSQAGRVSKNGRALDVS